MARLLSQLEDFKKVSEKALGYSVNRPNTLWALKCPVYGTIGESRGSDEKN